MPFMTTAKVVASQVQTKNVKRSSFDLPGELQRARMAASIMPEELASYIGCSAKEIALLETGVGSFEILMRAMDALKFDLTGIKAGVMLHDRLRATREARNWSLEKLALRSNLSTTVLATLENGTGSMSDLMVALNVLAPGHGRRASSGEKACSEKDSRFTPQHVLDSIGEAFGPISLDPCAHERSPVMAAHRIEKEAGGDGLTQDWSGDLVFVNPPYSGSTVWLKRVRSQFHTSNIGTLLCLLNAKTDATEFHAALRHGAAVFLFEGRLKYGKPDGTQESSRQGSMMLAFGTDPHRRAIFEARENGFWAGYQI